MLDIKGSWAVIQAAEKYGKKSDAFSNTLVVR